MGSTINPLDSWITRILLWALQPEDREVVLGDLQESGETAWQAAKQLFGLVLRRQLALWAAWPPWCALLGVSIASASPLSYFASGAGGAIVRQISTYRRYGAHYENGVSFNEDLVYLISLSLSVLLWSYASGFSLASLSGRCLWVNAVVFYFVTSDLFLLYGLLSGNAQIGESHSGFFLLLLVLKRLDAFLVLPAAISGMLRGARGKGLLKIQAATLVSLAVVLVAILSIMEARYEAAMRSMGGSSFLHTNWFERLVWLLLVSCPVFYLGSISLTATKRIRNDQ